MVEVALIESTSTQFGRIGKELIVFKSTPYPVIRHFVVNDIKCPARIKCRYSAIVHNSKVFVVEPKNKVLASTSQMPLFPDFCTNSHCLNLFRQVARRLTSDAVVRKSLISGLIQ